MTREDTIKFIKKTYLQKEKKLNKVTSDFSNYEEKTKKDCEALLVLFFSLFASGKQIDYSTARKYISVEEVRELQSYKRDLDKYSSSYRNFVQPILSKVRISRIEYLQVKFANYFEDFITNCQKEMNSIFVDNISKNLTTMNGYFSVEDFELTDNQLLDLSKEISRMSTPYGTPQMQIEVLRKTYLDFLKAFVPQCFARKMTLNQITDSMLNNIHKIYTRLHLILFTMSNYQFNYILKSVMEQLGIKEYEYCAILDDKTSDMCKQLDGNKFYISQAKVGVNFPPMHPNCRSFIIPII